MQIAVSKLDTARRQLETAIRLFFYDGDFVSTHTLAAASFNVLNDLSRQAGADKKSMRDELLEHVRADKKKWLVNRLRETENFMKHADRDPDETHSFDPGMTTFLLVDAVRCYWKITGENTLLTQAYFMWFMTEHPDVFVIPEQYLAMLSVGQKLMQDIPKSTFLEVMLPTLLKRGYDT